MKSTKNIFHGMGIIAAPIEKSCDIPQNIEDKDTFMKDEQTYFQSSTLKPKVFLVIQAT